MAILSDPLLNMPESMPMPKSLDELNAELSEVNRQILERNEKIRNGEAHTPPDLESDPLFRKQAELEAAIQRLSDKS